MEYYSPFLIEGLTQEDIVRFLEERLGHETCAQLAQAAAHPDNMLLLGLDLYRRERLLALWDGPQNPEEQQVIQMVSLGVPLGLHSLLTADDQVRGVTPVLTRLEQGDWRLGWEQEEGIVFSAWGPKQAIERAYAWLAGPENA
jgi:hypothetical protein